MLFARPDLRSLATELRWDLALKVSVGAALVLLVVRLVQRSTVQFVINALFGIAIGWYFVHRSAASGGSEQDQALAALSSFGPEADPLRELARFVVERRA